MSSNQLTRTQIPNLDEKYETYLQSNGEPKDNRRNPLNLFDELDAEDKQWFKLAQIYITQRKEELYDQAIRGEIQS